MKTINGFSMALTIAIAAASIGAWAQDAASGGASAGTAATASGGMTAKATRQANRALRRKVYAVLAKHQEIDAGNISIIAKGGAVMINGTVEEASQINTVAEIAKGVAGVTSVTNKLSVQRPLGQ
jgi:osmotically-inducible protein OsmY